MNIRHDRLAALRAELSRSGLDGFILSTGDEHMSEFPAPYAGRLAWLTGFRGTMASIAVLANHAAIFIDGRYKDAVRTEVDPADWAYVDIPQSSMGAWLSAHAPQAARIGYDAKLCTHAVIDAIEDKLAGEAKLVPVTANPVDYLWFDQPARPTSQAFAHPIELSGKNSADKRRGVADCLASTGSDACVLTALDSIAWLFNIRASDVDIVPLCYSFAICHGDGSAELFVDAAKVGDAARQHLGNSVRLLPYEDFYGHLEAMGDKTVSIDPATTPVAVTHALERGGATVHRDRDPTLLPKAIKNPTEIAGMKRAHIRDGAALTRFLHWFSIEAPNGQLTELSAAAKLNALRQESSDLHSLAFEPVSAVDANAAIPHYWPTPESDAPIGEGSIYLVDSGGQYRDGTTDVTRTVAVGAVRAEVRDRFTRVLKGHIALQTTIFPPGTLGSRLDPIARMPLWAAGLDYPHGTGHGVGHFLNVHEGPCHILPIVRPGEPPIEAGVILSNEPGYYKQGDYGIRIENLIVTVDVEVEGADRKMLGFEAITMAPIDRRLIDVAMLSDAEREWLDDYHATVLEQVGPYLPADTLAWLEDQTAPTGGVSGSRAEKPVQAEP